MNDNVSPYLRENQGNLIKNSAHKSRASIETKFHVGKLIVTFVNDLKKTMKKFLIDLI